VRAARYRSRLQLGTRVRRLAWRRGLDPKGRALSPRARRSASHSDRAHGQPAFPAGTRIREASWVEQPQEVEDEAYERVWERVAAIDVAKATGVVCTRVPGDGRSPALPGHRGRHGRVGQCVLARTDRPVRTHCGCPLGNSTLRRGLGHTAPAPVRSADGIRQLEVLDPHHEDDIVPVILEEPDHHRASP
jgi:hypothetical protein